MITSHLSSLSPASLAVLTHNRYIFKRLDSKHINDLLNSSLISSKANNPSATLTIDRFLWKKRKGIKSGMNFGDSSQRILLENGCQLAALMPKIKVSWLESAWPRTCNTSHRVSMTFT